MGTLILALIRSQKIGFVMANAIAQYRDEPTDLTNSSLNKTEYSGSSKELDIRCVGQPHANFSCR